MENSVRDLFAGGDVLLGIEFGSTRIKAVVTDRHSHVLASGSHEWENRLVDGIWTYDMEDILDGLQECYRDLKNDVSGRYGTVPHSFAAIGVSAMMHGYMAFEKSGKLLVPFRTWRNTRTGKAADELTEAFGFNIPQRWSIAHLYQAILDGETHVNSIRYLTTLAGYIHWRLTERRVIGIGDASGMFPIDSSTGNYDREMLDTFSELTAGKGLPWRLEEILPAVLTAGEDAGSLTAAGAMLLDPAGDLVQGTPMCPPEGDAGTGMAATNSVREYTGNVSAGTSVFAMVVLDNHLTRVYPEIDMVTTPDGKPVAMVHCNNCTSDLNAWVSLFHEFAGAMGIKADMGDIFGTLYKKALEGDDSCGGLLSYNYFSGEPITGFTEGRPLFVRTDGCRFNLANFMKTHLYSALATLRIGMDILTDQEKVRIDRLMAHGGLFKTEGVAQPILASAVKTPVAVMKNAGEGGAWGIAILAAYMLDRRPCESLADFLDRAVFAGCAGADELPNEKDAAGFDSFISRYRAGLEIERAAVDSLG